MKIPRFYHPDVVPEVLQVIREKFGPGQVVPPKALAIAREIVWARHACETIDWKRQHITINDEGRHAS